jgi:hypothetical protein
LLEVNEMNNCIFEVEHARAAFPACLKVAANIGAASTLQLAVYEAQDIVVRDVIVALQPSSTAGKHDSTSLPL